MTPASKLACGTASPTTARWDRRFRLFSGILMFALLASAAPLDLSAWKYRKRIPLTPGDGLAVVKLDREVYFGSSNWAADLRVIQDGKEVPFVLGALGGREERTVQPETNLLDRTVVPGVGLQFVIRVRGHAEHSNVELNTEEKNFRQKVRIETSQDGRQWAIARDDGAIFNFAQDGRELKSTMVAYPVSTRPFVRVTVFGWMKTGMVGSASVGVVDSHPPTYEVFAKLVPQVWEDRETKSTVVAVDAGAAGLPVSRLRLETESPHFHRAVTVETSEDQKTWRYLSQQSIARLPARDFTEESVTVRTWGAGRFLRLRIYNRDDQALTIGHIILEGLASEIKLLTPAAGAYWLYYGNSGAKRLPEYDLGEVLARSSLRETSWSLGPSEPNPLYRPPPTPQKPWSERHPSILYTVLGGAVVALGIATLRFMMRLRTPA